MNKEKRREGKRNAKIKEEERGKKMIEGYIDRRRRRGKGRLHITVQGHITSD